MDSKQKIIAILHAAGWSQEELARRLGVSFKALNSWVNGHAAPREANLAAIEAMYLDIVGRQTVDRDVLAQTEAAALATHLDLDELIENPDLLKTTTLYLTYHTNTIEGSTLTIADVEQVLDDASVVLADKTVREQIEARNHRATFNYLLQELKRQGKDFRWTTQLIKNAHLRLMNGLLPNAGEYRQHGVRIMGSRVPLANHLSVPEKLEELVAYMNTPVDNLIERLAITHAKFEQIHPFGDGNGRVGRLIMFIQAAQAGVIPPLVIKERKRAYYKYLEMAQMDGEYELLRLFVAESIHFTDDLLQG